MVLAYVNAKELIMAYIRDNGLKSGDRLPTESNFANLLGIGRLSLREGLNALKAEGVILSVQGSGTFVGSLSDDISNTLNYNTSVTQMIESSGRKAGGFLQLADELPAVERVQQVDKSGFAVQYREGQLPFLHENAGRLLIGVASILQFQFLHVVHSCSVRCCVPFVQGLVL